MPREEQDVIALFHQLIGAGVIRGIKFFGSHSNIRYDGLVELDYSADDVVFNERTCILGIPDVHAATSVSRRLSSTNLPSVRCLRISRNLPILERKIGSETANKLLESHANTIINHANHLR